LPMLVMNPKPVTTTRFMCQILIVGRFCEAAKSLQNPPTRRVGLQRRCLKAYGF